MSRRILAFAIALALASSAFAQSSTVKNKLNVGPIATFADGNIVEIADGGNPPMTSSVIVRMSQVHDTRYWTGYSLWRGLSTYSEKWFWGMDNDNSIFHKDSFRITSPTAGHALEIAPTGQVGIGRPASAFNFAVQGNVAMTDNSTTGVISVYNNNVMIGNHPVTSIQIAKNGNVGILRAPSDYALDVNGTIHATCGIFDATAWPRKTPAQALSDLAQVKGKMVDAKSNGKLLSLLDHSTLPNEVRKARTYVMRVKGDESALRKQALRNEAEIVGKITSGNVKNKDGKGETFYTSATVRKEARDIGGTLSFCILAIQALKDLGDQCDSRLKAVESSMGKIHVAKTADSASLVVGGDLNSATTDNNAIIGGDSNAINGGDSMILAGAGNELSGTNNIILGGSVNKVSNTGNLVHGSGNVVDANNVTVMGSNYQLGQNVANSFVFGDAGSNKCALSSSDCFYIYPDAPAGKVAIGSATVESGTKLKVEGGDLRISKGKIIVDGNNLAVPDYVFGADHKLMSIADLNAYIKSHKRLPQIPSAAEIQKNGLNVAEFQLKLLEKVEELNLYVIQQDKQLKDQARIIDELKARLNMK